MLYKFFMAGLVASLCQLTNALADGPKNWPCPTAADIEPCICSSDEYKNLRMDCSQIRDNDQLTAVFDAQFPFKRFLELKIDHDPSDESNMLDTLEPNIFHELTFERVIIKGTRLTVVEENAFSNSYETLKYMNLANNKLERFPFETIVSYNRLDNLVLDDNLFDQLPSIVSDSLQVLSVSGNSNLMFQDDLFYGAPYLTRINMARIDLQAIPSHLFRNLSYAMLINLEQNNVQELEVYAIDPPSNSLLQVLLNQNKISFVRHDAISGLALGANLNLANNEITELPEEVWKPVFEQIPEGFIDMSGNPLTCGCDMAWIYLDSTDSYRLRFTDTTTCYDGTQVSFLDYHYFQIQCS